MEEKELGETMDREATEICNLCHTGSFHRSRKVNNNRSCFVQLRLMVGAP